MKELTDEELSTAICRWMKIQTCSIQGNFTTGIEALGNMHAAEKLIRPPAAKDWSQWDRFLRLVEDEVHATPRQRAIALLWVVNPNMFQ
jgi:hypothetical protein